MKILGIKRSQSTRSKAEWMPALTDADRPEALAPALFERIARVYGPYGRPLLDAVAADPTLGEPLVEGLPVIKAEVLHATAHEYAATLDDLFARRTMLTTENLPWQGHTRALTEAVCSIGRQLSARSSTLCGCAPSLSTTRSRLRRSLR